MSSLLAPDAVDAALHQLESHLADQFAGASSPLALVGIRTGGAVVAKALQERLTARGVACELGLLDITLYRDDALAQGANALLLGTDLPFDVEGRQVVLVDDVLFTGRTIRAALDAICDLGRPGRVHLAVLLDRGGRELPIAADFVGATVDVDADQRLVLQGDDALEVALQPFSR